jgi:hypothetical protein
MQYITGSRRQQTYFTIAEAQILYVLITCIKYIFCI